MTEADMDWIECFPQPKPQRMTDKQKLNDKLAKMKARQQKQIERMKSKVKKAKQPSLRAVKASTQRLVNKYVKLRDKDLPCISCGKFTGQMTAGHFWTQGEHGFLRYNLDNIHKQCMACNHWKSGNLNEYRLALLKKVGPEIIWELDIHAHQVHIWTREELESIREDMDKRIEELEKEV